jgi:hypothetical protein
MSAAARGTMALKLASVLSACRAMRLNSLSSPKKLDQVTPFVPWPPFVEIGDTKTERIRHGD